MNEEKKFEYFLNAKKTAERKTSVAALRTIFQTICQINSAIEFVNEFSAA